MGSQLRACGVCTRRFTDSTSTLCVQHVERTLNDSYDTTICLQFEPYIIAAACLYFIFGRGIFQVLAQGSLLAMLHSCCARCRLCCTARLQAALQAHSCLVSASVLVALQAQPASMHC